MNDAREMMLREGSRLRNIHVSGVSFRGKWVPILQEDGSTKVEFEIAHGDTGHNLLQ